MARLQFVKEFLGHHTSITYQEFLEPFGQTFLTQPHTDPHPDLYNTPSTVDCHNGMIIFCSYTKHTMKV